MSEFRLRGLMRSTALLLAVGLLASAYGRGLPPRANPSDYPAHRATRSAVLAAAIVPSRQIEKMFSPGIARHYVVLEIGVYPHDGQTFDVDPFNFSLKIGDTVVYADKPGDVAIPWPEKNPSGDKPLTVVTETGVVYSRGSDPVNGRRSGWEVYQGVGATNDPRAAAPPPGPGQSPDPQVLDHRIRDSMLPAGQTALPVAGYLFFPQYNARRRKGVPPELHWSAHGASIVLPLPVK